MYFTIERAIGGFQGKAYGRNGELVWLTEIYVGRAGAENAIYMLKSGAASAPIYDRT